MGFGNLKIEAGLQALNSYLASRSYIDGYVPSQADVVVFEAVGQAPASKDVNVLRWYKQINSYSAAEKLAWPGIQKPVEQYGTEGAAAKAEEVPPAAGGDDEDDDDDDFDMFGEETEEDKKAAEKLKEERVAAYMEKKSKKPGVIAKSNIILDVKPWDDETDMSDIEKAVRSIEADGLVWGASKLVPLAYGIKKLQICCVVVDDKIGTDFLENSITAFEELVQSVDIAAFNKV